MPSGDFITIQAELARRELARRDYGEYLAYCNGPSWKRTHFAMYLARQVQEFITADTGHAYDILLIEAPPQHGKLCADSTPVPTPTGWVRHGDIKAGDTVFGPDGKPILVKAEIPQTEPASLRVTFRDGAQVVVHPRHEWVVHDRRRKRKVKLETQEMMRKGLHLGPNGRGGRYAYSVDPLACVQYPVSDQPVHPYFMGLWLGDGTREKPCITHHPDDMAPVEKLRSLGYTPSAVQTHKVTGILTTYYAGEASAALRSLGFGFRGCEEKHIPAQYKIASEAQRMELLAGMIDSDGYVYQRNGRVTISNANHRLIADFAEVVRSLGWNAVVSKAEPVLSSSGIQGKQVVYQLTFNPDRSIPTALARKHIKKMNPLRRRRAITAIEPCEAEHGKCLTVEGGVYLVGDHFTPTHNSMTVTEGLPAWYMGKFPRNRLILASYNEETAERFTRRNKEKIRRFGVPLFGCGIGEIDRSTEFEMDNGVGRMISRGILSGITGNPANLLIIDDPIKNRQEADSPTRRQLIWGEWLNSLKSRLAAGAKVVVIMTPWHEDDLAARLEATEQNLRKVRLPVEAELDDPLGREEGEPLCPEIGKNAAWLKEFRDSYMNDPEGGPRAWSALYQCSPRVEGGNLVKREWWRFYDPAKVTAFGTEVISVDAAFKGNEDNDYVAIEVWAKTGNDYYCRYCLNRHLDFPGTLDAIRTVRKLFPKARAVLIEDKANGSAIISMLQHEMFCIAVNPKGGKVARVNAVSSAIESGHVYLPEGAPWVPGFIDQFTAFPAGKNDDMVDSASQALSYMLYSSGETALPPAPDDNEVIPIMDEDWLDGERCYDVYGSEGGMFT